MAQITLSNPKFYRAGKEVSAVVGVESGMSRIVRYDATAPAVGASAVSLRVTGTVKGSGTRPDRLRCYIGTDPASHTDTSPESPYTCTLTRSGSEYTGSTDVILLPSTKYYIWIFPNDYQTYGWVHWPRADGSAAMTTTGAAGSTVTGGPGTLGEPHTLTLTCYAAGTTSAITAACGGQSVTIASAAADDGTITWMPPLSWAEEAPAGTSVQVAITCVTHMSGQDVTTTTTITMAIPASVAPTCSAVLSDPTGVLDELGAYVRSKSKLSVAITAAGVYGSTIEAYQIDVGGATASQQEGTFDLPAAGKISVKVSIQDSRGRWGTWKSTITVADYRLPSAEIHSTYRCTAGGTPDDQGDHAAVVFTAGVDPLVASSARYSIKHRPRGAWDWGRTSLPSYDGIGSLDHVTAIIPADPGLSYDVGIIVSDRWPPARESPYRSVPAAFALLQVNRTTHAIGIGQPASIPGAVAIGLPSILTKGLTGNLVRCKSWDEVSDQLSLEYSALPDASFGFLIFQVSGSFYHCVVSKTNDRWGVAEFTSYTGSYRMTLIDGAWWPAEEINDTATDYIAAHGTTGPWEWRRWHSGRAECWCTVVWDNVACTAPWGALYESTEMYGGMDYPLAFDGPPMERATIGHTHTAGVYGVILEPGANNSADRAGKYYFVRPTSATVTAAINFYVTGQIKPSDPQPLPETNFVLADGSALITSDGKIFTQKEA